MKEDIEKKVTEHEQRITSLENAVGRVQPEQVQSPTELAQEAHQAAVVSFQTKRLGQMNVSLNGAPMTDAQVEDLVRGETKAE